ncbi:hypothetical protein GUY44_06915 [Pimelobacter simplex]|uniref:hypothetical protein n=1 Tax=Nocardioides simplex TaxID=2045 RepID=UPI0011443890|nr:hypothetical protein [Pimelobacter simplex]MCG8150202.1 hypothetical protein [Pimelobacter simplex]GEB13588.1 hypothetical protein NSI01_19030 [Pimelobacter simplex]
MSDVNETLQDLMERRLYELGRRRGRGESISLREAWQRLPEDENGARRPTYEVFRRIRQAGHSNITDETADALATMLDVPVGDVLVAAGQRPRLGRFELPRRADRLTQGERDVVMGVVDAILTAGERAEAPAERPRHLEAARRGTPRLRELRQQQDEAGQAPDPEGPEGGA